MGRSPDGLIDLRRSDVLEAAGRPWTARGPGGGLLVATHRLRRDCEWINNLSGGGAPASWSTSLPTIEARLDHLIGHVRYAYRGDPYPPDDEAQPDRRPLDAAWVCGPAMNDESVTDEWPGLAEARAIVLGIEVRKLDPALARAMGAPAEVPVGLIVKAVKHRRDRSRELAGRQPCGAVGVITGRHLSWPAPLHDDLAAALLFADVHVKSSSSGAAIVRYLGAGLTRLTAVIPVDVPTGEERSIARLPPALQLRVQDELQRLEILRPAAGGAVG